MTGIDILQCENRRWLERLVGTRVLPIGVYGGRSRREALSGLKGVWEIVGASRTPFYAPTWRCCVQDWVEQDLDNAKAVMIGTGYSRGGI